MKKEQREGSRGSYELIFMENNIIIPPNGLKRGTWHDGWPKNTGANNENLCVRTRIKGDSKKSNEARYQSGRGTQGTKHIESHSTNIEVEKASNDRAVKEKPK